MSGGCTGIWSLISTCTSPHGRRRTGGQKGSGPWTGERVFGPSVFRPKVPTSSQMGSRPGAQVRGFDDPIGWCNRRDRSQVSGVLWLQPAVAIQGGQRAMSRLRAAPVRWCGSFCRALTRHVGRSFGSEWRPPEGAWCTHPGRNTHGASRGRTLSAMLQQAISGFRQARA